jgi:ankyrin repeat protein
VTDDHSSTLDWDRLYAHLDKGPNQHLFDYLAGGGDPNIRNRNGWSLLHAAAFKGRREAVEALVAAGADVGLTAGQGFTPLASAAHKGHAGCVRALLAAGADLDCRPLGMSLLSSLEHAQVKSEDVRRILEMAVAGAASGHKH